MVSDRASPRAHPAGHVDAARCTVWPTHDDALTAWHQAGAILIGRPAPYLGGTRCRAA
jgi:hypothetical protein